METINNNQPMLIDGLSCVCGGSKIYYSTINVEDMSNVNQLACSNCGIIMRSPPTDENGEWLKNHWKKTHGIVKTLTAERDEYKRRAEAAETDIFVEVMKQARRMCKEMDECEVCPLYDGFNECCLLSDGPLCHMDSDFVRYEADIMKGAVENPEFRFPTWHEWANEQFPDADKGMRTCAFISKERANCMAQDTCNDCRNQPIPADIARKLGIKPIAKENSG